MFDEILSFLGKSNQSIVPQYPQTIDTEIRKGEIFFKELENWRNLEVLYLSRLSEMQHNLTNRHKTNNLINEELAKVLGILVDQHKSFVNKLNHDVFMMNYEQGRKMIFQMKKMLQEETKLNQMVCSKWQGINKLLEKKNLFMKKVRDQETADIFMHDSISMTNDKKNKRIQKMKDLCRSKEEYDQKLQANKIVLQQFIAKSHEQQHKLNKMLDQVEVERIDSLLKFQLHLVNFYKSHAECIEEFTKSSSIKLQPEKFNIQNMYIYEVKNNLQSMQFDSNGYLARCLQQINQKEIDEIIDYSKDNEVKKKIKKIVTCLKEGEKLQLQQDQLTEQLFLVNKFLQNKDSESLMMFEAIVRKSSKLRMNFIFILQSFRLNNKFQIKEEVLKPMLSLIQTILNISHQMRDSFVLKQIVVLLLTYYVTKENQQVEEKIYLMQFFKECPMWRDLELWESILIQCIYIEKSATLKIILATSESSNKKELLQAQKTAVLNQIHYIVKNMILFGIHEKEVKEFSVKFVKLLKQDDKFLKDVNKSITDAWKQQSIITFDEETKLWIQQRSIIFA